MNAETGWYYLHTNGDLIFKRYEPEMEPGGFVRRVWPIDTSNRADAWRVVLEAAGLGASIERVRELAAKWKITPEDLPEYMAHTGVAEVNAERKAGMVRLAEEVWRVDLDALFDIIGATPKGGQPDLDRIRALPLLGTA